MDPSLNLAARDVPFDEARLLLDPRQYLDSPVGSNAAQAREPATGSRGIS